MAESDWLVSLSDVTRSSAIAYCEVSQPVDDGISFLPSLMNRLKFLFAQLEYKWMLGGTHFITVSRI